MSEYQYYEFRAVDQPLTRAQMDKLRSISSRAEITPNSLTNTYNYGSFGGNPGKLMEAYFDAFVYVSNFGTMTFTLRLPLGVVPEETLDPYTIGESLESRTTKEHTIVEWQLNDEEGGGWAEGEGWMSRLLPIRDELIRGDYRSLYVGWLSYAAMGMSYESDEEDVADDREPPVPGGLGSLTDAQAALAEFLGVDGDLIAAAAEASAALPTKGADDGAMGDWVAGLPENELRALLARVVQGEGLRVQTELQSRFFRARNESGQKAEADGDEGKRGRSGSDLLARAKVISQERKQREAKEKVRKRHDYLAGLVPQFETLWAQVNALAEQKSASAYDQVSGLLIDMRDAYGQVNRRPEFDSEVARYVSRISHRPGLLRRLKEARMVG